ncbi:MAG: rhamnogalacturonan acetylesterase [Prevotellaceae bacterium]|jgi:lysophospholipase L1-like esterase|nr:rhamnogalacturonan acetylesterase [Prevotellaceae bacterium]
MKQISSVLLLAGSLLFFWQTALAQSTVGAPLRDTNRVTDLTLDSLNKARTARPPAGSSRKENHPVLFLIGNSTMRTGTLGNGNSGQWGWGYFLHTYFDQTRISVENQALGGTSSRTFYTRLWPEVRKGIRPGDWVIIELGHNDNGPYDSGRARASIPGIGTDSLPVVIKETGVKETVYSYGEYLRRYISDIKERGAHPMLMGLTPRNAWTDPDSTLIQRYDSTFNLWQRQVAEAEKVPFIDLTDLTARKYERFGKEKVKEMFYRDRIHTSVYGARINAASAAEGIRACPGLALAGYLKPIAQDTLTGRTRKGDHPVLFTIGDSTVKNADTDTPGAMWGWGSLLGRWLDSDQITVENYARGGRSARTFLDEGLWDKVYHALRPGDYVLIQFGHNDAGAIDSGKERADLPGVSDSSRVFRMKSSGEYRVVYTFGWYLRKFVRDVREKGAIPILLSYTPRNSWKEGVMQLRRSTHVRWAQEVAQETGTCFIDLNRLAGDCFGQLGEEAAKAYYVGATHFTKLGAELNARCVAEGLRNSSCGLSRWVRKAPSF